MTENKIEVETETEFRPIEDCIYCTTLLEFLDVVSEKNTENYTISSINEFRTGLKKIYDCCGHKKPEHMITFGKEIFGALLENAARRTMTISDLDFIEFIVRCLQQVADPKTAIEFITSPTVSPTV